MTPNEYQQRALRTSSDQVRAVRPPGVRLTNAALGLAGETGEFNEIIKKWLYHDRPLDKDRAVKELGDVLWYIALAADALGATLEQVMVGNIAKLAERYPEGFDPDRKRWDEVTQ